MKARDKRIKKTNWTPEMKEYLRQHYPTEDSETLAKSLGVTKQAVTTMAHHLGVSKKETRAKMNWTPGKIAYLEENYATGKLEDMAKHLGCTQAQLKWRAQRIGLRRKKCFPTNGVTQERKMYFGNKNRIGMNQSSVTDGTRTLVCSCALSGYTIEQTAMLTERSKEQVEEVLEQCKRTGYYDMVKDRQEENLHCNEERETGRLCSVFEKAGERYA